MTTTHHHWPALADAVSNHHFVTNPPVGGTPINDKAAIPKAKVVTGKARPTPRNPAILSWPSASAISHAPIAPRIWPAIPSLNPAAMSNHSRMVRKNDALTTRDDSRALAAGGAPEW